MSEEACPTVNLDDIADSVGDLMLKIGTRDIKLPTWLKVGNSSYLLTADTCRTILLGMTLYCDAKVHYNER
jgi:hypothetical protein